MPLDPIWADTAAALRAVFNAHESIHGTTASLGTRTCTVDTSRLHPLVPAGHLFRKSAMGDAINHALEAMRQYLGGCFDEHASPQEPTT